MNPYILGGIEKNSQQFLITTIHDGRPYVLMSRSTGVPIITTYYFAEVIDVSDPEVLLPLFIVSMNGATVQMYDITNGGGLSSNGAGLAGNAVEPGPLLANTSRGRWNTPVALLSDSDYALVNTNNSLPVKFTVEDSITESTTIRVIPITWVGDCTTDVNYVSVLNAVQSYQFWACKYGSDVLICNDPAPPTRGYLDFNECVANLNYTYCATGTGCGPTCKGPCGDFTTEQICSATTTGFLCEAVPTTSNVWMIVAIIFIVLAILILFAFIIYAVVTSNKKKVVKVVPPTRAIGGNRRVLEEQMSIRRPMSYSDY